MRLSRLILGGIALAYVGVAMCDDMPSSGFLSGAVESKLKGVKLNDGREVMRWISPAVSKSNYNAVMVDRVIYYPAPNPGPQVSSSALEEIADYLTRVLREELARSAKVVDRAGPGVLRIQPAITAVIVEKEGLSAKDIVPVHLLFSAAKSASGSMDEDVTAMVEIRVNDSMTREVRAAVKMSIKGEQLEGSKDQLSVKDFKASLDRRAKVGAEELAEALKK